MHDTSDGTRWRQINIAYPGQTPHEHEQHAVAHLTRVLPAAEAAGLITGWWFIRKGPWRIRYLPAARHDNPHQANRILTDGVHTTNAIYEPETPAFGGPAAMTIAHTLFHDDSRHILTILQQDPADRRERSVILCTALMRAAGLDLNEQGDVWAKVLDHRSTYRRQPPPPDPRVWDAFTGDVRHLITGTARTNEPWNTAFTTAGTGLRNLYDTGELTRGIRAVIALHVIFRWNRLGLPAETQIQLAHAATDAVFDPDDTTGTAERSRSIAHPGQSATTPHQRPNHSVPSSAPSKRRGA